MMKLLRSQSQTVLVVVLGVIGLGFLFYGNSGNFLAGSGGRTNNDFGRIDGEDISQADLTDAVRNTRDSLIINGHAEELRQRGSAAQVAEEAWRQMLLLREADRLHIVISDPELVNEVHGLPIFQKDGVYSPEVYEKMMKVLQNILHVAPDAGGDPLASTKAIFETVMRNDLRVQAVSRALFANCRSSAGDVTAEYAKLYGPATVSVVTFDPKTFAATAQVTPADIEAEYKAHQDDPAYRTKEKRKVDYVLFTLTPEQASLPDAQKAAAKDALGQKALDFALAFQPEPSATDSAPPPAPDFLTEAKKHGLTPATTDFFMVDTTPANVPPSPAFNNAAFSLTKESPISKVIEFDNGVAVLHLSDVQASQPRPLDEVKADILKKLQEEKGLQAAKLTAQITAKALQGGVSKSPDFKTATAGMNLKVATLPAFVPAKTPESDPRLQTIAGASISLKPGQISDPFPVQTDNTILVIHLEGRAQADPAGLAAFEARFRESQDERLRSMVYIDWTNWKSKQPGTHKSPYLDVYGAAE